MPRILTLVLMLHWATVFTLLAGVSLFDGAALDGIHALGLDLTLNDFDERQILICRAVVSFSFTICAVLFWWSFATLLLSLREVKRQSDDVLQVAFSAAALLMTLLVITGAMGRVDHLLPTMATHIAALIASYVAIHAEIDNLTLPDAIGEEELRLAARVRALDASQVAALARFAPSTHSIGRFNR